MYYYGGYSGYGNNCCCGGGYPSYGGYGYGGGGYGAAIILVLFILLVIVIGARAFRKCSSFWQTDLFAAESIGDYAFEGTGFAEIDLTPVRNLGKGVFKDCQITQCTFGSEFTEIPEEMFAGCEYLQTVQPINQLTNVGRAAFKGCSQFSNLEILKVASIGEEAFAGTAYTRLDFSQITERFYAGAFRDCQNLEWVSWPSSNTYLPDYLFAGCSKLSTIEGLDRITDFGSGALMGCPISSIPFSPEAQHLSSSCFEGTLISSLDLTNTQILHIPDAGFKDCQYLTTVEYLGTTAIENEIFAANNNIKVIVHYGYPSSNFGQIHVNVPFPCVKTEGAGHGCLRCL